MTIEERFRRDETKDMFDEREERIRQNWPEVHGEKKTSQSGWEMVRAVLLGLFLVLVVGDDTEVGELAHAAGKAIIVGQRTPVKVNISTCDTLEQAIAIINEHKNNGHQAGYARYMLFNRMKNERGEPLCGYIEEHITVRRLIATVELRFKDPIGLKNVYVVHFELDDGRMLYGMVIGVSVKVAKGHTA